VLAFQTMSGDPGQEHFADGMVDDVITSLSKVPKLFVIGRIAALREPMTYQGTSQALIDRLLASLDQQ